MKYIKTLNEYEIRGYDRWKTASPYEGDPDCETSGELNADIIFDVDNRADYKSIPSNEFKKFCNDVDQFLDKYFKKYKLKLTAVSPINTKDTSYQDWVDNGDGTTTVGVMSWNITGDFKDGPEGSDNTEIIKGLLPSIKELQDVAKKYKWVDQKKIWIEDIESDIDNPCDSDNY